VGRTRPMPPRWNIFPKKPVTVDGRNGTERGMAGLRWGLVPHWYSGPGQKPQPQNARTETADLLPEFPDGFRHRRCPVTDDGPLPVSDGRAANRLRMPPVGRRSPAGTPRKGGAL
jgi:putative SOS response-associated peptidase YedK